MILDKYQRTHNGNGASNMNERANPEMFRGNAEYLASTLGFTNTCEISMLGTAGINKIKVI